MDLNDEENAGIWLYEKQLQKTNQSELRTRSN